MLINQSLRFTRIWKYTWKMDILLMLTCISVYLVHHYFLSTNIGIPAAVVTLLGTALAFFIGFNNNQSYGRWWEARTIWGALVNDSRSWARGVISYVTSGISDIESVTDLKRNLIRRQLAFVYSLKTALRKDDDKYFERYLSPEEVSSLKLASNIPNTILTLQAKDLQQLSTRKSMDEFRFMQMNSLLTAMTDHLGKSERIRNTVFPASYIYFTRLFIWVLVVFVTLSLAGTIGAWSILNGWIIGAVFHITHMNGMGLVDPFDEIPTGIPLNQLARTIEIDLLQMLSEKEIPEPIRPIQNDYIL